MPRFARASASPFGQCSGDPVHGGSVGGGITGADGSTERGPVFHERSGAGEKTSAGGQVDLEATETRWKTELGGLVGEKSRWVGPEDGVCRLQNCRLDGLRAWQHEAARQDTRIVREAVADDGGKHGPSWLVSASWGCLVYHVPDGCGYCGCLGRTLRGLASCMRAGGV